MQDDDQGEEDRRAERHIERVKREAGEGAHVEWRATMRATSWRASFLSRILNRRISNSTDEGAPLEAPDTRTTEIEEAA